VADDRRRRELGRLLGLSALPLVLAAVGGWLFAARNDFAGQTWIGVPAVVWLVVGAVVLVLGGIAIGLARDYRNRARVIDAEDARAELRVAMKDALQPLLRLVSRVAGGTPERRADRLLAVAESASLTLAKLLMAHVDRARAAVYAMEPDGRALRVLAYGGRGEQPGDFVQHGSEADQAIERVRSGRTLVVHDRRVDAPPGTSPSSSEWKSFIAVPIVSGDGYAYGMVVVDSPAPDSFLDTETHIVTVVAEILAIGFALAYPANRRRSGGDVGPAGRIEP
jgi:putative methionine-R-sulfoxide reductase with GAF domain